ncbi:MAG TPA: septum formation family protein, partial [Pseudonocardia sp.]|nr:septum formation family protein [Pseudonocardia sp.]
MADAPPPAGLAEHPPPTAVAAPGAPVRRIATGVLVGALTMFGVATLDAFAGAQVPVLSSITALPSEPAAPEVVELPPPPADPGTCLMWTRPDAADTAVVDCAQPHLFEQAGSVRLVDQTALPDDAGWRRLVEERCTPVVTGYLDGKFDPDGRYRIGALKPSPAKWEQGDRELRCGLQSASRSGALYPTTGRVAEQDQSAVHEPGTCLGIDGRTIGDPVDCAGPHAVETVGIVDLSEEFPEEFPAVADQDEFLQPECTRIAGEYAGGAEVIEEKKLTVYWNNLTEASWTAGSRRVNCNLAALLPDRSGFAPVTGPVKGSVVVGAEAAPPATATPQPG